MPPYLSHYLKVPHTPCWEPFFSLTEEICFAMTMGELGWAGSSSEETPETGLEGRGELLSRNSSLENISKK